MQFRENFFILLEKIEFYYKNKVENQQILSKYTFLAVFLVFSREMAGKSEKSWRLIPFLHAVRGVPVGNLFATLHVTSERNTLRQKHVDDCGVRRRPRRWRLVILAG